MAKIYQVVLTTSPQQKQFLSIEKVAPGQYKLVGAQGIPDLEDFNLAFDVTAPYIQNLDADSDSFTCFGLSEHLKLNGPELLFKDNTFYTENLTNLQAGLDRMRGTLIGSQEY